MKSGLRKKIHRQLGRAVHDWQMIQDGDRILVGVSGGSDSQALLHLLHELQGKAPVAFKLIPVHIDPGFEGSFSSDLEADIRAKFGPLHVEHTDYGIVAHSQENRENPCFLCARLRRKRLFELAKENGCSKVALGHNKDDLIETLFINIFYAGKIGTMKPRQSFFNGALEIIRPLSYVEKNDINAFSHLFGLQTFDNPCPSAGKTKRSEVKGMLEMMYKQNPHIKGNIFRAMGNIAPEYLLEKRHD
ncbi:MAG: tRNA 2-thiocytidine(32) synthetase TtcA [Desulfobacterales bacterium]|nr:tRNA 2-thiocytidine(32) synthetase TtcA [Desulfobacterales bacterium]